MTLELYSATKPVAIAHFSSRTARAFEGRPRRAALAISGLLGQLAMLLPATPNGENRQWPQSDESGLGAALLADADFARHISDFQRSPLAFVEHLWWVNGQLVEVGLTQPGHVQARPADPKANRRAVATGTGGAQRPVLRGVRL